MFKTVGKANARIQIGGIEQGQYVEEGKRKKKLEPFICFSNQHSNLTPSRNSSGRACTHSTIIHRLVM